MTPHDTRNLNDLLHIFGAARLGEGDPAAGANLLAAMATSIANISPPGSGLQAPDGDTLEAGASLLVSGSHGASLVAEKVLRQLGTRQNHLNSHLRGRVRQVAKEAEPRDAIDFSVAGVFRAYHAGRQMEALFKLGQIREEEVAHAWTQLLQHPASIDFDELHDRHVVFVAKGSPDQLAAVLDLSHLGRPCVHVGVGGARDFTRFGRLCVAVMDGRGSTGFNSETIRGTVILTDPAGIFGEVLRTEETTAQLASRMIWLIDGNAGPEPGKPEAATELVALDAPGRRYEDAMGTAWGRRLDHRNPGPDLITSSFHSYQARWIAFLKEQDAALPGIMGTARNLVATLVFGLTKMIRVGSLPKDLKWSIAQVEALARFMIHRMANARSAMLHSLESARRDELCAQILYKLGAGPLDVRGLTRKFNRLPAGLCREVLLDLEASGKVARSGEFWQARQDGTAAVSNAQHLTLEL